MNTRWVLLTMFVGCTLWVTPTWALFEDDEADLIKHTRITLVEAVEKALDNVQGKAVGVELEKEDDNTVFEVKVIDETGTKQEVYIDGQSGNVLKIEKD